MLIINEIMTYWDLFLKRGKRDLDISERIFKNHDDFEMAAYMAQQALEKHVKSYLMKSDFIEDPKKVGHFQIPTLISLIGERINIIKRNSNPSNPFYLVIEHYSIMLDHLRKLIESIKNDDEKLIHWWKYSLKIIEKIDDKDYEKFVDLNQRTVKRLKNSFGIFENNQLNINLQNLQKVSKELTGKISQYTENMNKTLDMANKKDENLKNESLKYAKDGLNTLNLIFELKKQGKLKNNSSISELEKSIIISNILVHIELILSTYPHESIGRYPKMIDKEHSSTDLYTKRKDDLWELIQQVKTICIELENKIRIFPS